MTCPPLVLSDEELDLVCDCIKRQLEYYDSLAVIQASAGAANSDRYRRKAQALRMLIFRLRQIGACDY